jgi:hypothetical protein
MSSGCSGLVLHAVAEDHAGEPGTGSGPSVEQGQLPLLGIEPHQRPHNLLHHAQQVLRIASVEFPALAPCGVALAPECSFSLGFGHLLGEGDHGRLLCSGYGAPGGAPVLAGLGALLWMSLVLPEVENVCCLGEIATDERKGIVQRLAIQVVMPARLSNERDLRPYAVEYWYEGIDKTCIGHRYVGRGEMKGIGVHSISFRR